jgi:hypothetical protein
MGVRTPEVAMKKKQSTKKISPMITALAEWAVDDALAAHDQFPGKKRSRLPRKFYKDQLANETPPKVEPKRQSRRKAN